MTSVVPYSKQPIQVKQVIAVRHGKEYQADYVPHLSLEDVRRMVSIIHRERDKLLVMVLFDSCLRASEAVSIRPQDITQTNGGWQIAILGKGGKRSVVAVSSSLVASLHSYAYRKGVAVDKPLFPIQRTRVFQIVKKAMIDIGINKPDGVGTVHVLRHSGAIERLRHTGNPKAVQDQLRHKSAQMTLRYLKTLSHEESLAIQQQVDYRW